MNKKRLATLVGCLALVGIIGVGATLAYMTDNDTATNIITMGHVDIELTEPNYRPNIPNEEDGKGGELTNVTPGAVIAKDPTIKVLEGSEDAYIRVQLTIASDKLTAKQITELESNLGIDETKWKKIGEYYYFIGKEGESKDGVLSAGNSIKLFEKVKIPSTWGNKVADASITIDIKAEAIQASNFTLADDGSWLNEDGSPVKTEKYPGKQE